MGIKLWAWKQSILPLIRNIETIQIWYSYISCYCASSFLAFQCMMKKDLSVSFLMTDVLWNVVRWCVAVFVFLVSSLVFDSISCYHTVGCCLYLCLILALQHCLVYNCIIGLKVQICRLETGEDRAVVSNSDMGSSTLQGHYFLLSKIEGFWKQKGYFIVFCKILGGSASVAPWLPNFLERRLALC